jgi:hypothetical protein
MNTKLVLILTAGIFLFAACGNKTPQKNVQEPQLSIETCYQENLKDSTLMTGWYYVTGDGFALPLDKTDEIYKLNPCPSITAEDIIKLNVKEDNYGYTILTMQFGDRGTKLWSEATEKAIGNQLAFVVDNHLLYTPMVNSQISGGMSSLSKADYSKAKLENIKQLIEKSDKCHIDSQNE